MAHSFVNFEFPEHLVFHWMQPHFMWCVCTTCICSNTKIIRHDYLRSSSMFKYRAETSNITVLPTQSIWPGKFLSYVECTLWQSQSIQSIYIHYMYYLHTIYMPTSAQINKFNSCSIYNCSGYLFQLYSWHSYIHLHISPT